MAMTSKSFDQPTASAVSWERWALFVVLLIGLVARLIDLDSRGFWVDEAFTALLTTGKASFQGMIANIIEFDAHPPGYYALVWLWGHIVGTWAAPWGSAGTEWWLRFLSVILGLTNVVLVYRLAREHLGVWGALAVALILALHPLWLRNDREARMYSMLTTFALLSQVLLQLALRKRAYLQWFIYGLSLAGLLYTQYLAVFIVCGQFFYIALHYRKINRAILLVIPGLSLYAFWFPSFLSAFGRGAANAAIRPPASAAPFSLMGSINYMADLNPLIQEATWVVLVIFFGIFLYSFFRLIRVPEQRPFLNLLLSCLIVPIAAWLTSTLIVNTVDARYAGFLLPYFYMTIIYGIFHIKTYKVLTAIIVPSVFLMQFYGAAALISIHDIGDWRAFSIWLDERRKEDDLVITNNSIVTLTMKYYNPQAFGDTFSVDDSNRMKFIKGKNLKNYEKYRRVWLIGNFYWLGKSSLVPGAEGLLVDKWITETMKFGDSYIINNRMVAFELIKR
jgi:uncharacterized membrane protein